MGQKVNPHGARVGVIFNWSTRWYAGKKDFANNLVEDYKLREMLKEKYYATGISHIDIERSANRLTINIFTAKPGIVIGRGGAEVESLKKALEKIVQEERQHFFLQSLPEADFWSGYSNKVLFSKSFHQWVLWEL